LDSNRFDDQDAYEASVKINELFHSYITCKKEC